MKCLKPLTLVVSITLLLPIAVGCSGSGANEEEEEVDIFNVWRIDNLAINVRALRLSVAKRDTTENCWWIYSYESYVDEKDSTIVTQDGGYGPISSHYYMPYSITGD
jgi:hypothetical protein